MAINKHLIIALALLGLHYIVNAQENNETFTIYLVRHSEKELSATSPKDPPLSICGQQRSESLNNFLKEVHLNDIYSTDYTRTKNTALPTATSKGIGLKLYNPQNLTDFAKLLIERKENALVVGHSNTTGVLAGLLVGEDIGAFDEGIYNRIYQIVIHQNKGRLHLLHSAFVCVD